MWHDGRRREEVVLKVVPRVLLPIPLLGLLTACTASQAYAPSEAEGPSSSSETSQVSSQVWAPPAWYPEDGVVELGAIEGLDDPPADDPKPSDGPSGIRAPSVLVYDVDRGEVLFERKADVRRPIASVTKLFASLALASEDPDLDRPVCVTYEHWPVKPGARSHLNTGECFRGWDLLGAALVKSDNRAAMTFSSIADLGFEGFVDRMNDVAQDLGATSSSFEDPAGLGEGNLSTARDVVRAIIAVSLHPTLSAVASAKTWRISTLDGERVRELSSTDFLLDRGDLDVLSAKTGYTDPARYCFASMLQLRDGHRIAVAILGDERPSFRVADMDRIVRWVRERDEAGTSGQAEPAPLVGG
jgi:D-alanyl-D-alanine endopeptidase (penicillin-binding protein 7)